MRKHLIEAKIINHHIYIYMYMLEALWLLSLQNIMEFSISSQYVFVVVIGKE